MKKQAGSKHSLWTRARVALACAAFAATALAASGCKSDDTANLSANQSAQQKGKAGAPKVDITSSQPGAQPPRQQQGQLETVPPLAWNTELQSVEGAPFRLSDYKDKVVVLNLWATWCGPCRQEIPHMVELNKEYASKGVELIGLTTESPQADEQKVRDFVKSFNIDYTIGWARADLAMGLMRGRPTIPQTFVVVPGGRVVAHFPGFSQNLPAMLRAALDKATNKATGD